MAVENSKAKRQEIDKVKCGFYLCQNDVDYVLKQADGVSTNKGFIVMMHRCMQLEGEGLMSLRDFFTPNEWRFMAALLRYKPIDVELYLSKDVLARQIMDHPTYDYSVQSYEIDAKHFLAKLSLMSSVQTMALNVRIRDLWAKYPIGKEIPDAAFKRWSEF